MKNNLSSIFSLFANKKALMLHTRIRASASCLGRCSYRARARTGAAFNAGIRVNHIFRVSLGDRTHRAFCCTGTTGNAFIRNLIRHSKKPPFYFVPISGLIPL